MLLYIKKSQKNLSELINSLMLEITESEDKKDCVFIYWQWCFESEIKKTIPLTIISKRKYIGINLANEIKELYTENYKSKRKNSERYK